MPRNALQADLPHPALERIAVIGLVVSGILAGAGGLLAALDAKLPGYDVDLGAVGLALLLAGLASGIVAAAASIPITTLRHLRADVTGGSAYDRLRGQRPLRVASALLSFLIVAGALLLLLLLGTISGVVGADIRGPLLDRGMVVIVGALGITAASAHWFSLGTPIVRDRSALPVVLSNLALGVAALSAGAGVLAWTGNAGFLDAWVDLTRDDVGTITLLGFVTLAFGLARTRTLPTPTELISQERQAVGRDATSRNTSVLIPAVIAFSLLLVVFLLFLMFGIGVGDLLLSVGNSPLLLGILVFLLVALMASIGIGLALARSAEKEAPLYTVLTDAKRRTVRYLVFGSGAIGGILLIMSFLAFRDTLPHALWLHLLCLGLLVILGPYGFWANREHNRVRHLEERFPDFLRDIASSHKGGLTLHQSVTIAARGEYGPLTPEVRKMADQLSWNVSFNDALERFSQRVETPLVQRAVSLIMQADRSGGSTTDVLLAAARDAREIKNLENERRLTMSLYTVVVYITFFVFLGVAAVLYAKFAPQIVASNEAVAAIGAKPVGGLGKGGIGLDQYRLFYFTGAVVQGVGDGILAGLLGSGKASLGLRHAFLMVLITYVTFALLLA